MSVEDAATFVAATDIVGDGVAGAYPRGLSVSLRQSFLPLAEAPLNSRSRVGRSYQVDWPMIGHTTPWGYGRAERMLADAESSWQGQPNPLHGAWIMVMTALIEEALSERRQVVPSRRPKPVRQWDSLVHQVVALPRDEFVDEWLISIGWLCTPEMGWDIEYAPPPVPRDLLQEIESRRREHYSRLPADSMASADSWRIPLRG